MDIARQADTPRFLDELESALYRGLVVLDTAGTIVAACEGSDYDAEAGRESFGKALSRARSRTGLAESFGAWDEGERFFVLYCPIRDPDSAEVVGLIRATMDAERLFTSVSDFRFRRDRSRVSHRRVDGPRCGGA